jgi:hypothetical protein
MPQESRLHEFCLPPLLFWVHRKAVTKGRMLKKLQNIYHNLVHQYLQQTTISNQFIVWYN